MGVMMICCSSCRAFRRFPPSSTSWVGRTWLGSHANLTFMEDYINEVRQGLERTSGTLGSSTEKAGKGTTRPYIFIYTISNTHSLFPLSRRSPMELRRGWSHARVLGSCQGRNQIQTQGSGLRCREGGKTRRQVAGEGKKECKSRQI